MVAVKLIAVLIVSGYADQASVTSVTPSAIVTLTNKARTTRNIAAVAENAKLKQAARAKANDMVKNGYFAHISPTKVTPWTFFKQAGYAYTAAGENLAIDYSSSEDIIDAWLASPSHRANLLSTRFKEIGVATATGTIDGATSLVVVQMFGARATYTTTQPKVRPAQTPDPVVTQTELQTEPEPIVIAPKPSLPPATPILNSPASGSVLTIGKPTFVGRAEPGSVVTIVMNGQSLASGTVPADGVFSLTPSQPFEDGNRTVSVTSTARGLVSPEVTLAVTVDTKSPQIAIESVSFWPAFPLNETYDVTIPADADIASATVKTGARSQALQRVDTHFVGRAVLADDGPMAGMVRLVISDAAGNVASYELLDAARFHTGVIAAPTGPMSEALKVLFFSRAFLTTIFGLVFVLAAMNVAMNWRRRHHPAVLGALLMLYLAGTLAIL